MSNLYKRLISSIVLGSAVLFLIYKGELYFDALLVTCFLCGVYEILNMKRKLSKFLIFSLFILFIHSSHNLRNIENGMELLYLVLTITWLSDIGGFLFGKYIGGKKIKIISPNKTYIGFFGSLILSQLSFIILKIFSFQISVSYFLTSLIFLISSSLVIVGDLTFSYFKRLENLKDYSNLIPGHGGIFDRIDGLIFTVIFFNLLINFI